MKPVRASDVAAEPVDGNRDKSREIVCVEAVDVEQIAAHHRVRHAVFVEEQRIFTESDLDDHDARGDVVRVLALSGDRPVGAVRLYPLDPRGGLWKGDRLAVLAAYRAQGAGAPLVRFAVAHARTLGGKRMIAHIQLANVRFFERLGWSAYRDAEDYLGRTHQPMEIVLAH